MKSNHNQSPIIEFLICAMIGAGFVGMLILADKLERDAGISGCSSENILEGRCK